jgi:predicted transcriptional regulator
MKLEEIRVILKAQRLWDFPNDIEVCSACGSDLMSDVLALTKEHSLLLTGLTNSQVIRTAEVIDLSGIVFVRGKRPGNDVIQMAEKKGIPLLLTQYPMYEACGILFKHGVKGSSQVD